MSSAICADHSDKLVLANEIGIATSWDRWVCHGLNVSGVARKCKTAEFPPALNGCEHGVVVVVDTRTARRVVGMRNGDRDHVAATGIGVAAAAGIAKSEWPRAGEITLIPSDENHGVTGPCARFHYGVDRPLHKGVASGDQGLHLEKSQGSAGVAARPCMSWHWSGLIQE